MTTVQTYSARAKDKLASPTSKLPIAAACFGNFIEFYDFIIWGYFATVLAALFFPSEDPVAGLLVTYTVYAVSYIARPLGGLIFGYLGDRYGRRTPLTISILLIAGSTALIGLMPTYASIGIAAPILLTLLRLAQGVAVGGEYGGAMAYISENAPIERRGLYSSWQYFTLGAGLAAGAAVATLFTSTLSAEALHEWGWRVPFLLGAPLGVFGLVIRLRLDETPSFKALRDKLEHESAPIRTGIKKEWRTLVWGFGLTILSSISVNTFFVFMPAYLEVNHHYSSSFSKAVTLVGLVVLCALVPLFGALSDKIGRKPILIGGSLALMIFTYPLYQVFGTQDVTYATLSLIGLSLIAAPLSAVLLPAIAESFPTTFRYTGSSLSLNIATMAVGGTAPLFSSLLIRASGSNSAPALLVCFAGIMTLAAAFFYRERAGQPLRQTSDD
ncbi:MAG TPA: MFS transporter [Rhizobium sp.]